MSDLENVRKIWLTIRLNDEEQKRLKALYKVTTCKALSEYARDILLQEPVVINYRNQSLDETLSELSQLVTELNAIGRNFNQAVKKLHTLDHLPELQTWILLNESSKQLLFKKIDEIKNYILQMHEQWLQK
jgi:pyruvate dehydrogenase complex dehydrogenase (E1) component